jgi:hypothetical protein
MRGADSLRAQWPGLSGELSPRARGQLLAVVVGRVLNGASSTSAGPTYATCRPGPGPWNYPRVRGANLSGGEAIMRPEELSRVWGRRVRHIWGVDFLGAIPACARTTCCVHRRRGGRASSPIARGQQQGGERVHRAVGAIPAYPGPTGSPSTSGTPTPSYPRVRGANFRVRSTGAACSELSPGARGQLGAGHGVDQVDGAIPACAGPAGSRLRRT